MLMQVAAVHIHIECLRKRLPLVVALESHKVLAIEAFYHLELVADVIIGQRSRLAVRERACHPEADIVPVDVGMEVLLMKVVFWLTS